MSITVPGLDGISTEVSVASLGVAIMPTSGMNVVNQGNIYILHLEEYPCVLGLNSIIYCYAFVSDAGTDLCADLCGDGVCESLGNMVRCSGCPEATNPVTCSMVVCDPAVCHGICSQLG